MRVLTTEEVADILRLPADTIRKQLREGKLPGRRIGRHWRVLEEDLQAFLQGERCSGKP